MTDIFEVSHPQNDADNLSAYIKKDFDGDHGGTEANGWTGDEENLFAGAGSGYLDDVAYYMERNDARPLEDGLQNVTTHTIGFTVANSLLEDTAVNGGGIYQSAYNVDELNAAFQAIIGGILAESTSYSAPVVPISQIIPASVPSRPALGVYFLTCLPINAPKNSMIPPTNADVMPTFHAKTGSFVLQ